MSLKNVSKKFSHLNSFKNLGYNAHLGTMKTNITISQQKTKTPRKESKECIHPIIIHVRVDLAYIVGIYIMFIIYFLWINRSNVPTINRIYIQFCVKYQHVKFKFRFFLAETKIS